MSTNNRRDIKKDYSNHVEEYNKQADAYFSTLITLFSFVVSAAVVYEFNIGVQGKWQKVFMLGAVIMSFLIILISLVWKYWKVEWYEYFSVSLALVQNDLPLHSKSAKYRKKFIESVTFKVVQPVVIWASTISMILVVLSITFTMFFVYSVLY